MPKKRNKETPPSKKISSEQLKADVELTLTKALKTFTGTENYYHHSLGLASIKYTDGVKFLADTAGSYWLLDEVLLGQIRPKIKFEPFQTWKLEVKKNSGTIIVTDGNNKKLFQRKIKFTDFPLDSIELFYTDNVLMLTGEY